MKECPFCGDALHGFIDVLEDGCRSSGVNVCPTCYRFKELIEVV